jgi:AcrR family transcriptional regulator
VTEPTRERQRAIARHAGVSHGAPLRHFPSLAALLAAMAASGFARLVATIDAALAGVTGAGPRTRLAAAGRTYVAVALAEPGVFSVDLVTHHGPGRGLAPRPEHRRPGRCPVVTRPRPGHAGPARRLSALSSRLAFGPPEDDADVDVRAG